MEYLASALYIVGLLSFGIMLLFLMAMGKRLGEALEMPHYHRLYLVSILFFIIPLPAAWILLLTNAWNLPDPGTETGLIIKILVASVPMTLAITPAVYATAKYWSWIWGELKGSDEEGGGRDAG
ncbi:MAG: hypothetical protein SWK76_10200 [Actinomycetota bacterium]|nr:hypothetical protein [Actinomycetota bacterium]